VGLGDLHSAEWKNQSLGPPGAENCSATVRSEQNPMGSISREAWYFHENGIEQGNSGRRRRLSSKRVGGWAIGKSGGRSTVASVERIADSGTMAPRRGPGKGLLHVEEGWRAGLALGNALGA
jgi:hypothetical protein